MTQEIFAPGERIPPSRASAGPAREIPSSLPLDPRLAELELLAYVMDSSIQVPGTHFRFGMDALLGLIPGIGDTVSAVISSYIVKRAHDLGAPAHVKIKMGANIAIDWAIGLIPFAGDLFDFGWKANRKNLELLKRHLEAVHRA